MFTEEYEEMKEFLAEQKYITEESNDDAKAIESIKWLIENDWGKDNNSQGQATQRFKGLAFSDSKISNKFMDKINKFTSSLKIEDFV
jgi:hypothetical protein